MLETFQEGGFVDAGDTCAWIWGPLQQPERLFCAVRHRRIGDRLERVPKYALTEQDLTRLSQIRHLLAWAEPYAMLLAVLNTTEIQHYYSPITAYETNLGEPWLRGVSQILEEEIGIERQFLGLGGSRLIGVAKESSDIDINVYSKIASKRALAYLRSAQGKSPFWPTASTSHTKFLSVLPGADKRYLQGRTPLTLTIQESKIDFHFYPKVDSLVQFCDTDFERIGNQQRRDFRVIGTDDAIFLPGVIDAYDVVSDTYVPVLFTDKRCLFLVPGDQATFIGTFSRCRISSPPAVRGKELTFYFVANELASVRPHCTTS